MLGPVDAERLAQTMQALHQETPLETRAGCWAVMFRRRIPKPRRSTMQEIEAPLCFDDPSQRSRQASFSRTPHCPSAWPPSGTLYVGIKSSHARRSRHATRKKPCRATRADRRRSLDTSDLSREALFEVAARFWRRGRECRTSCASGLRASRYRSYFPCARSRLSTTRA